ncbi:MAG: RdgB/HAM1 family non-canonical purine NTP pyrophosphatase [Lachnospiraceae bacterium]|nr:RdgB/HAM1 family non-canonical purine NTP pyrophosphatase [Lachnospiraceae bacterium]MBR4813802.1 RdgB/HAM1 family non-canonical purine NTP pyrophosphatase [Lachnospiraceae bacterium]
MSERERLVFATGNEHKMIEIRAILGDRYDVVSMKEAGIRADIVEDGKTFEENALIKASAVSRLAGCMAMADDSGLEVDYLGGMPGIYSARFLGEDTSYDIKNQVIIDMVAKAKPSERTARFVCAIACAWPDGRSEVVRGTFEGEIAKAPAGPNGFGYDPIFLVPELGKTSAEIAPEEKNAISHRGNALRLMRARLEQLAEEG